MKNTTIIIPTRLKAKRFPNKPLAKINNVPMIIHTLNRGLESGVGEVYVATPDNEIIEIVKKGVAGDELSYKGKEYILPLPGGEGKAIRSSAPPCDVPVWVASLGPSNLEMTGAVADGWLGGSFIPETGDIFIDRIKAGAEKAGKDFTSIEMMIPLSLEFTDDVYEAGKRHARGYGFTFGAMGSIKNNFYKDAYVRQGYGEAVNKVQKLWKEGKREEAREEVPLELAFKSNLIGTS